VRVLVDTSVWSLALRRKGPLNHPKVDAFSALLRDGEAIVLVGIILQEILQAFRDEATVRRVAEYLDDVPLLDLNRGAFRVAARIHRQCAAIGVSVSTADCQIAAAALSHRCALLTADRDFERIARVVPLRLF
jgi:predicted nucleic acid-binding protein